MPRALLSVTDKTQIVEFATGLVELGFDLVSTGGTARTLRDAGLAVKDVAEVTGFPEMLDGRVKTLHPLVHGGLLGDLRKAEHRETMGKAGILPFEVVCVNLYAFEKTVTGPHDMEEAIESIDIGGPAMIRSGAKNWANVAVVVDPSDYARVLSAIAEGRLGELRLALSAKAFRHTAFYDSMVSRYLTEAAGETPYSETLTLGYRRSNALRYGENPHQRASVYVDPLGGSGVAQVTQHWGIELGYNNYGDAFGAWELVCDLPEGSCAIVKHGNPCGAAYGRTLAESFRLARAADPLSAFGGVVACHGVIDEETAEAMTEKGNKLDVILGEGFTDGALELFRTRSGWGQEVRLLSLPIAKPGVRLTLKTVRGGALAQDSDEDPRADWKVVTKVAPTEAQMRALAFQWAIIPHVRSNAIIVGTENQLLGVGAGQMNRVQSVRLALEQAGEGARGAVLASDAFFPFPDSVETAGKAGIAAIVQPGGSKKDGAVVAAADDLGIAMVMTGTRHFLH